MHVLKKHPTLTHTQTLLDICKPLALFDITTFVHVRMNQRGELSGLCTNPNFLINYVDKSYHNADIHVRKNHADLGSCLLWDAMECFGETEKMVADAARHFNYRHNFTLIKTTDEGHDYYHFGTHLIDASINQWHVNNLDILNAFIGYFTEKVAGSPELSAGYNIVLPTLASPDQCELKLVAGFADMDSKRQAFLQAIAGKDTRCILSPRQTDCLKLLVQGLSAKEIAKELNLSHRTVDDHLAALRHKFQAKNKTELILKSSLVQTEDKRFHTTPMQRD